MLDDTAVTYLRVEHISSLSEDLEFHTISVLLAANNNKCKEVGTYVC